MVSVEGLLGIGGELSIFHKTMFALYLHEMRRVDERHVKALVFPYVLNIGFFELLVLLRRPTTRTLMKLI